MRETKANCQPLMGTCFCSDLEKDCGEGAGNPAQWLKCLLGKWKDPQTHINTVCVWQPTCNSSLGRWRQDSQSELVGDTNHISELWV